MKIIHVIDCIDPADGGPPGVVMRLAAAQAAMGHAVHVAGYTDAASQARIDHALRAVPGVGKVGRHLLARPVGAERILELAAARLLMRLVEGADAMHIHGVWEPILKRAAVIARRAGIAYCVSTHGMLDPWSLRQKRWKKKIALGLGYRRMLDEAAFIQVLNDDEAALMAPLGLRAPTRTIPNGIFLDEVEPLPAPGAFATVLPALAGRRFILFVSRLHAKKGLDYLVEAFARLARSWPEVDLVVTGPDGGAETSLRRAVAAHGLDGRVHLTGGLYGVDKMAALVDAACFCLPSRQEGFSVAIVEALACRLPVVISRHCHFPEVSAAGAGTIVDLDPAEIAEALGAVLSDREFAHAMGQAGRALIERRYTWPVIAETTIEAYHRAAGRPGPAILPVNIPNRALGG